MESDTLSRGASAPRLSSAGGVPAARRSLVLDMVHHNPGEPPFRTAFTDPAHLRTYGFNGQVFKHINCVATFAATGVDVFPAGSPDRQWLERMTAEIRAQNAAAKAQGLRVYYHIDLFVLPRRLVEALGDALVDPQTGKISLDRSRTLEVHRILFDELAQRFPEVDGYIVRVGETYLFDTPYHVGNGPIPPASAPWTPTYAYPETLGAALSGDALVAPAGKRDEGGLPTVASGEGRVASPVVAKGPSHWGTAQEKAYVQLLRFLRDDVCARHGRDVIFRTWDIFPDRLHARVDHYLAITDRIEPHPRLVFSIKHTALDFWRRVRVNDCLGRGRHAQVIEVQCQREYEGKGAFPNYVMAGVLDGFPENEKPIGLRSLLADPHVVGVYSWSRGGGWYGPYLKDELWCDLNAYVLAQAVADPARSEEQIFLTYARDRLQLTSEDAARFRRLCLLSSRAVLTGRYCEAFDRVLRERVLPTACWMRDDRLGGRHQLELVLDYLARTDGFEAALAEKAESVRLWEEMSQLAAGITWSDPGRGESVRVSVEYGRRLFAVVREAWRIMVTGFRGDRAGRYDEPELRDALAQYHRRWAEYQALAADSHAASLFRDEYFALPGGPAVPGLGETVRYYEAKLGVQR